MTDSSSSFVATCPAPATSTRLTARLLNWFADHARALPWREAAPAGCRDPYAVWVAEVMLQQTQVNTVIPYFVRFMRLFPTVHVLAAAEQNEVLKAWEGMGYYARARNLHAGAQIVVRKYAGEIPGDTRALRALPGVGHYMAAAIRSFAFSADVAALDSNGRRVMARLCAVREPIDAPATVRRLEGIAAALLPAGQAGRFNEALFDFGALVCTARRPACAACPVADDCEAQQQGAADAIPVRRPRRRVPHHIVTAAVIWQDGQVLITQRPNTSMLGGLWEFPGGKCEPAESLPACLRREIREELALEIEVGEPLVTVEHAYTHMRITLHAFHCRPVAGDPQAIGVQDWRWVAPAEVDAFPLSVADQRIVTALLNGAEEPGR